MEVNYRSEKNKRKSILVGLITNVHVMNVCITVLGHLVVF